MKTIASIPTSISKENAVLNLIYHVVLFNTKNSMQMSKLKSLCFYLILFFSSYFSNAQCAYTGTPLTQVGSDYTFCVDNGTTYTTGTVNSGQYVVVNVVKGFTYTFSVGNVFTANENLTILNASTNANVSPSRFASGASGATISNWVATLSGKIKILLSRGNCSNSNVTGGAITLTLNVVGNTQDSQTAYGTDQWVAHVYNWTGSPAPGGASPSTPSTTTIPFTSANYVGYYNVATESISDTFGGDYNCFPVYSNGVVRTNMYTEQFAVRYRMRSTKTGCYSLSTTGDDGVRVYVDGVKVYDEWKEQSPTSYSNILLYLNGNSDIIFDYYENGGQNVNSFSLTPFNASSNTIAQNTVTACSGVSPGPLDGSSYAYTGGATNPTISFQWQSSTDNSTFTNISGATLEDYTPPTQTATTTNVVRYYRRIVTAAAATANGCSYTSNVTTVATSPGVPATPSTISGLAAQCPTLTNQVYAISATTNTISYNWTVPTGWTITSGAGTTSITVTTGASGQNGNISVAAVNGCGSSTARTLAVIVNSNNTFGTASSTPTLCVNTALTSITHTTTGATGIGAATGLPTGVTAVWSSNTIIISGTPSISGTFNYSIPLTGGCGSANATGTIIVNPSLPASVNISASATTICSGTSVTFTATPTNGGTTPSYQWKVNGSNVGANSSTYTTSALANGNTVSVVMTSNATPCLTGSPATSNTITMTVNPNLPASVSIGASATTICSGTSITFTATPTNGGTTPSYQWKVNGSNVGTNSATYTSTTLANGNTVSVVMTSNATPCLTSSPTTSNTITMTVNPNLPASVSIGVSATTICSGTSVTFTATPTNGGSTPFYQWKVNGSNVGTNSATYTTSALANGNTVSVVMTSNATPCLTGSPATSNIVTMTVNALPNATIASNNGASLCAGSTVVFTVTGTSDATITYNLNGGSNATATLTSGIATINVNGATSTQMLNLVSVSNGCTTLIGSSSTVSIETTIWNGSIWDNGLPNSLKSVVFTGDYTMTSDFSACSISVSNNAVVSVDSGKNVSLNGAITVASGSSFILNTNANLYQSDASAVNLGNIIVRRDSNPLIRLDYTMWSSPVTGQKLLAFSPLTSIAPTIRFYTYNTTTNSYNSVSSPSTTDFAAGKGYLIRLPYNHPTAPAVWNGAFTGVPNNGTKMVTLTNIDETHQYNAVGNPYPSPISVSRFLLDNASNIEPTIYFWRKTNNAAKPSYCTWNCASQTFISNGEAFSANPNGVIQTGQGFIVEAKGSATSLEFNNGQRMVNNTNHFFKTTSSSATTSTESHRIWLNLTGAGTEYSQAVVGYFTNATQGADDYDSKLFNDGSITLSTKIGTDDYVIQSRPAPFDASDIVPLSFKVTTAGTYTFTIDHVDGLFTAGAQEVYIKDNLDGSYHNITATPYSFASASGTFSNRFELVYQNLLSSNQSSFTPNSIVVYHQQNEVVINTGSATMSSVKVYDIRGRLLVEKKDINTTETRINVGTTNQVLLVQVTTTEGLKATKKVVN